MNVMCSSFFARVYIKFKSSGTVYTEATGIMNLYVLQMEDVSSEEELFEPSDKVCNPYSSFRFGIMCASFYEVLYGIYASELCCGNIIFM